MHFLEPNFKIFLERLLDPPIKGGLHPPHGPDKTTAHLFSVIVRRLLKVILPLQYFQFLGEPSGIAGL